MKHALQARHQASRHRGGEGGYILLTLLLMVALLIVVAAAALPPIAFEIRRDREEEMIHRGAQYARAIRAFYKKFNRYPTRIEELESTNNLRFLRKRYKDPLTGKDFKLLHYGEAKLTLGGGLGAPPNLNSPASPLSAPPPTDANSTSTGDQNQTDSKTGTQSPLQPEKPSDTSSKDSLSGQTFGGGPIVGVISASKKDAIREFNHKRKYNEWQFVYDPATDRGGLISTPNQPQIQGFGNQPGQTLQPGGSNNSPFGPQPGQNTPPNSSGPSAPPQQPNPPNQ